MVKYHELTICGLKRQLPIKAIGKNTKLANFNILGDVELVDKVASKLLVQLKGYTFDYIVGPEVKVVPLLQVLAEKLEHKKYVVCRKKVAPYMVSPIILKPLRHFPKHVSPLVLDGKDVRMLKGAKVAIVDDVVSTGVTMRMLKKMMEKVGATVSVHAAVIRQGEKQFDEIDNFVYLTTLPIFKE